MLLQSEEMSESMTQRRLRYGVVASICIIAAVAFWYATPWGVGLSPDSAFYIKSARILLGRQMGGSGPEAAHSSHFPPGYPMVLAAGSIFAGDPIRTARGLGLAMYVLNTGLICWLVMRVTRSVVAGALAGLFAIFAWASIAIHMMALSEGQFLTLALVTLLLLDAYLRRGKVGWLIGAAIAAGAGTMTRYAGVSLVATGAVVTFLLESGAWGRRLRNSVLFGILAALPFIGLTIFNHMRSGSAVNREATFHLISQKHMVQGLIGAGQWLAGEALSRPRLRWVGGAILIAFIVAGVSAFLRLPKVDEKAQPAQPETYLPRIIVIFAAMYVVLLAFSISFVDFYTQPDFRLMSPVMFVAIVLAAWWIARFVTSRGLQYAMLCGCVLTVLFSIWRGGMQIHDLHQNGAGYASRNWARSPILEKIRTLPSDCVVYSNAADVIYLLAQRPAAPVPALKIVTSAGENPHYDAAVEKMQEELENRRAVVAIFYTFEIRRPYYPTGAELKKRLGLHPMLRARDGVVFDYVAPTTGPTSRPKPVLTTSSTTVPAIKRRPRKLRTLTKPKPAATIAP